VPVFSHLDLSFPAAFWEEAHRTPMRVAYDTLRTEAVWFDGIDPAVGWAITSLLEAVEWPSDIEGGVRHAVGIGYRMARILLGDGPHPSFDRPELTDLFGAAVSLMATEVLDRETNWMHPHGEPEAPPTAGSAALHRLRDATDIVGGVLALAWGEPSHSTAIDAAEAACSVLLPVGQAVALVEDCLARSRA